jgi:hypothetical protein
MLCFDIASTPRSAKRLGKYLDRDEKLATSAPAFPAKAGTHGSGAELLEQLH